MISNDHCSDCPADRPLIRPPKLVPLFPITTFVPGSVCPHGYWEIYNDGERIWRLSRKPPKGTSLVCMVCHKSGKDGHPGLKRDRTTDPTPDPKPSAESPKACKPAEAETRRQRRRRLFGEAQSEALTVEVA